MSVKEYDGALVGNAADAAVHSVGVAIFDVVGCRHEVRGVVVVVVDCHHG